MAASFGFSLSDFGIDAVVTWLHCAIDSPYWKMFVATLVGSVLVDFGMQMKAFHSALDPCGSSFRIWFFRHWRWISVVSVVASLGPTGTDVYHAGLFGLGPTMMPTETAVSSPGVSLQRSPSVDTAALLVSLRLNSVLARNLPFILVTIMFLAQTPSNAGIHVCSLMVEVGGLCFSIALAINANLKVRVQLAVARELERAQVLSQFEPSQSSLPSTCDRSEQTRSEASVHATSASRACSAQLFMRYVVRPVIFLPVLSTIIIGSWAWFTPLMPRKVEFFVYRAEDDEQQYPLGNNVAANAAGVLQYLHTHVVDLQKCQPQCTRKGGCHRVNNITRVRRFHVTMQNTWQAHVDSGTVFGRFYDFQGGKCLDSAVDLTCKDAWQRFGYVVGCQMTSDPFFGYLPYRHAVWVSFPQDGRCAEPSGQSDCTWSWIDAGEVPLDKLVGIQPNFHHFCEDGGVEYSSSNNKGLIFWQDGRDPARNLDRTQKLEQFFQDTQLTGITCDLN